MTAIQTGNKKVRVLIVDDSALVRRMLSDELSKDEEIEVVGTAPDPVIARNKIVLLEPDVLLLDVELPKMDGLSFLERLMKYYPMPVIIISSYGKKGSETARKAIELGAYDVMEKPESSALQDMVGQLSEKIKQAARGRSNFRAASEKKQAKAAPEYIKQKSVNKLIAIGASTGGTEAIKDLLMGLPAEMPPILAVQHMPQNFTKSFAERLDGICRLQVKEAEDEEPATPGKVLIAPGNRHMVLRKSGGLYYVKLQDGPLVFHQRPAVEVMFESVATYAGSNAIGIILTGMGRDGASGLLKMKEAGAFTIAQDERSCVVFGMPKEAIQLGAAAKIAALEQIPQLIIDHLR